MKHLLKILLSIIFLKETEADQVDNSIREDLDGNSEDEISQDNTDVESENIEETKKEEKDFYFFETSKEENEDRRRR